MDKVEVATAGTFLAILGIALILFGLLGVVALWIYFGWYWAVGAIFLAIFTHLLNKWVYGIFMGFRLYFEIIAIIALVGTGWAWAYGIISGLGLLIVLGSDN